jgi:CO dehydrogenase maturation factor
VKIAFAGTGGSGKTVLLPLLTRHPAACGTPVAATGAGIGQHLARSRIPHSSQAAA